MVQNWEKRSSGYVGRFPFFQLRRDLCVSPRTGKEHTVYVFETRDWINIIPITADHKIVMVRQFRFGSETISLEIPGGLADHGDESLIEAARREMLEETGYDAEEIISLGSVCPNPAIQNNVCHSFLAKNVQYRQMQNLDAGEDIQVELIPLSEINPLIRSGAINNSMVLNAFFFLHLYEPSLLKL